MEECIFQAKRSEEVADGGNEKFELGYGGFVLTVMGDCDSVSLAGLDQDDWYCLLCSKTRRSTSSIICP